MAYSDKYNERHAINKLHDEYKLRKSRPAKEAYLLDGIPMLYYGIIEEIPLNMSQLAGIKIG